MSKHALLSPSSAHRWLVCTPSARLEAQYPDSAGESAKEGTFAHKLAELALQRYVKTIGDMKYQQEVKALKSGKSRFGDYYTRDMDEYVGEYVDLVIQKFEDAKEKDTEAALLLEQSLDFSDWVPEGFGRGDAIVIADGTLEIIDLKYGRNTPVTAVNNPQIRLYGLGAYNTFGAIYDIETVCLTIMQPRNGGESSEVLSVGDLLDWAVSIQPSAQKAYEGKGDLTPGPHCQFCRAAVRCRALAAYQLDMAKYDFKDADQLTDTEVADVLARTDELVTWANKVKSYALTEAVEHDVHWPGWKLVEGRAVRKISEPDQAAEVLSVQYGHTEDEIYKPRELKTITQLEKIIGKKTLADELAGLLIKPPGKPTLVPESDKRPEWNSAQNDFKAI
ncbi:MULTISPECIES: DUF2800 domain-containing protein [unclassified Megasphaera]|uniref:DUF2800 domain-containing protein n=1 Tax=unclassified Megasphaera TaxID=2626256 RepID=UPI0025C212AF|nr:DUF2800 domain-containing protein [Megasphaera sp. UBA4233]